MIAQYEVLSRREVLGHEHGDVFYADLDPIQEVRLVAGGHLKRVDEEQKETGYAGQPRDGEKLDRDDELERELEA